MNFDLNGKIFRSLSNTDNGKVGADTIFRYFQEGNVVTTEYDGFLGICRQDILRLSSKKMRNTLQGKAP